MSLKYYSEGNILLEKNKAIYFFIPKVACTSLKKLCVDILKINLPKNELVRRIVHKIEFPHIRRERALKEFKDYFKFAIVRNPWDRLVSLYFDKFVSKRPRLDKNFSGYDSLFKSDMSFESFVEAVCSIPNNESNDHFKSQTSMISKNGEFFVDFIGRFENLSRDFEIIKAKLGTHYNLEQLNESKSRKDYRTYYNDKTREMVRKKYSEDIQLLGYSF